MRHLCTLLLIVSVVIINGRLLGQTEINGTVVVDNQQPVEFCAVVISGKSFGAYTNSKGEFSIPVTAYSVGDTIHFSFLGYREQSIPITPSLPEDLQIKLAADVVNLNPVEVKRNRAIRYKKDRITLGQWKKRTPTSFAPTLLDKYLSFAQFVPNKATSEIYLEKVGIYLSGISSNTSKFLLDVYSFDPSCKCPGKSLLSTTQLISKPKKGWNDVDIEEEFVNIIGSGFFVVYVPVFNDEYTYSTNSVGYVNSVPADRYPIFIREGGANWDRDSYMNRRISSMLVRSTAFEFSERQSFR